MTTTFEQTDTTIRSLEQKFVPERAQGAKPAVIGIALSGEGGGDWHLAIGDGAAQVHDGAAEKPNATIKASASDFLAMLSGELDGTRAFMTGRVRASGNMRLLTQFGDWFGF
jgi:putative sterol carrier protein